MTIEILMLIFEIIIAINVIIQGIWFYIWLQDRKDNRTNYLLDSIKKELKDIYGINGDSEDHLKSIKNSNAEISNQQLEIIDKLDMIRLNTMNTAKNTNTRTIRKK